MPSLLAALVLACCCLTAPAQHMPVTADQRLAWSEQQGQGQRVLNWPEAAHG